MQLQVGEPSKTRHELQSLYGKEVLPDDVLAIFNQDLESRVHMGDGSKNLEEILQVAFATLTKHLFLVEERPVVTRFWLFTTCVFALLTMKLLKLPELPC